MNKYDLISEAAEITRDYKKDAEIYVNAVIEVIKNALLAGDNVRLSGFGTFTVKERKEKTGRNPKKPDEEYEIPASKVISFKTSPEFRRALNSGIAEESGAGED